MPLPLGPNFVLEEVTREDLAIASLAWGFTLGFGWLTTWAAVKQTFRIWKRYGTRSIHNTYIWLIWLEILVCAIFSVICWLYLWGNIGPSFAFYFAILTCWALQVQFLLQIIINRCALLIPNRTTAWRLKYGVALLITAVNISVYTIWVPARMQISEEYIWVNEWWDRCEKVIYLIVDGALNVYFILIVKKNLISNGLAKYKRLTNFNIFIICFSLGMDVLIISMMSLNNTFVYMQFHPLAYMAKLKIEMSMAELIAKIARKKERLPTINTSSQGQRYSLRSPLRSFTRSSQQIQPLPPARHAVPFRVWNGSLPKDLSISNGGSSARVTPLQSSALASQASAARASPTASAVDLAGQGVQLMTPGHNDLYMVQEITVESEVIHHDPAQNGTVGSPFLFPVLPTGSGDGRGFLMSPPPAAHATPYAPAPNDDDDDDDDDTAVNRNSHDDNDNDYLYGILPVLPDGRLPPPEGTARQLPPSDDDDSMREAGSPRPVIWDGNPVTSTLVESSGMAGGVAR